MHENKLLLSLIKDHLVHSRLINGLYATGIEVDQFCLDLSDTIFQLAGLAEEADDHRYDHYLTLVERINQYKPTEWPEAVEPLAREIYATILAWQKEEVREMLPEVEYE